MNTTAKRYVTVEEPSPALDIIADLQLWLEEIHDLLPHIRKRSEQIADVVGETHSFVSTLRLRLENIEGSLRSLEERLPSVSPMNPMKREDLIAFFHKEILEGKSYRELRGVTEKAIVDAALETTEGNRTKAAKRIGLSRFGLQKVRNRLIEEPTQHPERS